MYPGDHEGLSAGFLLRRVTRAGTSATLSEGKRVPRLTETPLCEPHRPQPCPPAANGGRRLPPSPHVQPRASLARRTRRGERSGVRVLSAPRPVTSGAEEGKKSVSEHRFRDRHTKQRGFRHSRAVTLPPRHGFGPQPCPGAEDTPVGRSLGSCRSSPASLAAQAPSGP